MGIHQNLLGSGASEGEAVFTVPGTYTWVAPTAVTAVDAVCIGGGGGGYYWGQGGQGGGGGGLGWKNNIPVVPGQSYTVVVGSGGTPSSDVGLSNDNTSTSIAYNPNGSAGLTTVYSGDADDTFWAIPLPITIGFRGLPWTTVYVGSNGYVTFTGGFNGFNNLSAISPPGGSISIYPGDRRTTALYAGHLDIGLPTERFVIRQDGYNFNSSPAATPNAWEVHFYPNQVYFDVLFVTVPSQTGTQGPFTAGVSDGSSFILTFNSNPTLITPGTAVRCTTVSTLPDTAGSAGGASYFINLATVAGLGGQSTPSGPLLPVAGGGYVGDGGGSGGSSPAGSPANAGASGGGGAGGYTGNGGDGGSLTNNGSPGAGGGGGGGGGATTAANSAGGGGGGTGLTGQGNNGAGGAAGTYVGGGGGGYNSGTPGSAVGQAGPAGRINQGGNGGTYGGGAGCSRVTGSGGSGAVRLIWGTGRSFPNDAA